MTGRAWPCRRRRPRRQARRVFGILFLFDYLGAEPARARAPTTFRKAASVVGSSSMQFWETLTETERAGPGRPGAGSRSRPSGCDKRMRGTGGDYFASKECASESGTFPHRNHSESSELHSSSSSSARPCDALTADEYRRGERGSRRYERRCLNHTSSVEELQAKLLFVTYNASIIAFGVSSARSLARPPGFEG